MVLRRCDDLSVVDWVTGSSTETWQLLTFGPDVFEASARLRLIPDPTAPGQQEGDVEEPPGYPTEAAQSRDLLRVLGRFTTTPDEVYYGVWLGDGMSDDVPRGPEFDLPWRDGCALFVGDVGALGVPGSALAGHVGRLPAMVWPADRAWYVACDVDPHWAGIGASRAAVDALVSDRRLDAVRADPRARQPTYF